MAKQAHISTVEDLLDQEPFSPQIRQWLRDHPEVRDALKILVRDRFVPTHAASIVTNPLLNGVKQSIGIFSVDKKMGCMIKQDYLMHEDDDTFVLFTGLPSGINESEYVQHVKRMEPRYGPDGQNFFNNHHPTLEEVPSGIRPYVEAALKECQSS